MKRHTLEEQQHKITHMAHIRPTMAKNTTDKNFTPMKGKS
jgi:hypothetical protein